MAQPLTILIVDDSPEDRHTYRRHLQQESENNYEIIEYELGEEALEFCQESLPDAILLDFLLPDVDGLEFLSALQKIAQENMPAVVMLTGYGNEDIAVQAMKSGVDDYLVKGQTTGANLRSTLYSVIKNAKLRAELYRSEKQLRESQNLVERIAETTPGILYVYDLLEQQNVYLNHKVTNILEYTPQSIQALGEEFLTQIMHPDDLAKIPSVFQQFDTAEDGEVVEHEYRMRHANGEWRWFNSRNSIFNRNPDGSPRQIVGTAFDITSRKQIEQELRDSNERFQLATAAINSLIYDWDIETNQVTRTEGLTRILGYLLEETEPTPQWWQNCIHPDDLDIVLQQFQTVVLEQERYTIEYRVRHKNQQYIDVLDQGIVIRNQQGKAVRVVGSTTDISEQQAAFRERKSAEVALRQSEAKFRRIVESNIVGVYFGDFSGKIYEANNAFLEMLGYTRAELEAGQMYWNVMTPPEYQDLDQQKMQELQIYGACNPFEKEYLHKDGSRVPILLGIAQIEGREDAGYAACFVLNLSQRKRAEAALRRSEEHYRYLSNVVPHLVWICNPQGECEHLNQRWYEFTGRTIEQSLGFGWKDVIHPDDLAVVMREWTKVMHIGEPYEQEMRYRKYDGSYRWHLVRAIPIKNQQGEIRQWFGSSTDIDDYKQLQAERDRLLQLEKTARTEAEAANRAKDEFVAMVSHDLRSPLNAILGWAQLLKTRNLDEADFTRAVETIERNAKSQAKLLEDLLDISRILRSKLRLELTQVNLAAIISVAIETAYPSAQAKNIIIESAIDQSIPSITGDIHRLLQVLGNLLSNAIKFTPDSGRIIVTLSGENAQAQITVTDTGIGIDPEFLPQVFERYHQANIYHQQGGLGLGLAIARHLVELHGGTINVTSPGVGKGATFIIKLPLL
ncbi:PAS domain-containing protein [Nostoc sp. CMAA1605]|uniref:PAS domain-containing protein n=1 Tax=Nostoc sp. CMAA1605 TaxID=2055159 RepID=UPI001F23674E|nr:PAS domain-containing protein [Nostoc sp. CMAA1605]MCF4969867.1 hybrid sensor histidine kinase/response regulator [Nostoc sp. CMAA1605]